VFCKNAPAFALNSSRYRARAYPGFFPPPLTEKRDRARILSCRHPPPTANRQPWAFLKSSVFSPAVNRSHARTSVSHFPGPEQRVLERCSLAPRGLLVPQLSCVSEKSLPLLPDALRRPPRFPPHLGIFRSRSLPRRSTVSSLDFLLFPPP